MRYTVQYQNTTSHWVVFDNESFTMLGSYRSEEEATIAALGFEERLRQRRTSSSTGSMVA